MHPFALLFADQDPIKMSDLPQLSIHLFSRWEDQLEFGEKLLVFSAVFFVVFQKVHSFFDFYAVLEEKGFQVVQINEPLVSVLYLSVFSLLAHGLLEVKSIDVAIGRSKVGFVKPNGEILVAIYPASV